MRGVSVGLALTVALSPAASIWLPPQVAIGRDEPLFDPVSDAALIYSQPKTGTSTLYHSIGMQMLPPCSAKKWNVHDPRSCKALKSHSSVEALEFLEGLPLGSRMWVFTVARNPFDQASSSFFQGILHDIKRHLNVTPVNRLMRKFHAQLPPDPTRWWTQHLVIPFGMNITKFSFDHEKKILELSDRWKGRDIRLLALRYEDIGQWEQILRPFFSNLTITSDNIGTRKSYGKKYREFLDRVVYSDAEIDVLSRSEAMHFYTPKEVDRFVERARRRIEGAR